MSDAMLCPTCERVADAGAMENCVACTRVVCDGCDRGTRDGEPLCWACDERLGEASRVVPPAIFTKGWHTRSEA